MLLMRFQLLIAKFRSQRVHTSVNQYTVWKSTRLRCKPRRLNGAS